MIGLIDYNAGNIGSWIRVLNHANVKFKVIKRESELNQCSKIILPGVGSYDSAINELKKLSLFYPIFNQIKKGTPILGVCLGMQLLTLGSEEGKEKGMGLLKAEVKNIHNLGNKYIITPHIGFNTNYNKKKETDFLSYASNKDYYFLHSYAVSMKTEYNYNCLYCNYENTTFISAIHYKNIYCTQFHPEKSGSNGINLIKVFIDA